MIYVLVTGANLVPLGQPIGNWTSIDCTPTFNQPGPGTIVVPATPGVRDQVDAGNRIEVWRDGELFMGGPIEVDGESWSVDGADSGAGTQTVNFTDDLVYPCSRITYPNPAQAATAQTANRWTSVANAEDIMRSLVNLNAGPGALVARQVAGLILGADVGVGTTIDFGTRFQPLGDELRRAAIIGGGLGFRVRRAAANLVFEVYLPADNTDTVRFSRGLGNLRSYSFERGAPTATRAIVGGQDEGASRLIVERGNTGAEADWWRIETFVDQRQSDDTAGATDELNQAGDEALTRSAETAKFAAVVIDSPTQQFGEHYGLGDKVSVEVGSGAEVAQVVRAVNLQATPDGGTVLTPLIGSQDATADPMFIAAIREVAARLARLEAR